MADPERIILERVGDGERWKVRTEGGDAEGHVPQRFEVEPDGEDESGEPLFRIGGEDAEGHKFYGSDRRLKRDLRAL